MSRPSAPASCPASHRARAANANAVGLLVACGGLDRLNHLAIGEYRSFSSPAAPGVSKRGARPTAVERAVAGEVAADGR